MNSFFSKNKNVGNKEETLEEYKNYSVGEFVDVDLTSHHTKGKICSIKMVNGVAKFKIEVIGIDKKPYSNYEENISLEKLNKLNGTEQRITAKRYERSVQMNSAKSFKTN